MMKKEENSIDATLRAGRVREGVTPPARGVQVERAAVDGEGAGEGQGGTGSQGQAAAGHRRAALVGVARPRQRDVAARDRQVVDALSDGAEDLLPLLHRKVLLDVVVAVQAGVQFHRAFGQLFAVGFHVRFLLAQGAHGVFQVADASAVLLAEQFFLDLGFFRFGGGDAVGGGGARCL